MSIYRNIGLSLMSLLLAGCAPRVATSFWKIGTPADSIRPGYTVIHAEGKTRHCYPITEWTSNDEKVDTYHSLHHHGVAVESEVMAYRIYFDKKQTIDPYCKRKPQLELGTSYWYPNDSLLAAGYGDDILRVSGTVGVGSVKYWNGKKMVHIEPVAERSQRIVRQTRNAATIEVAVKDWKPLLTSPEGKENGIDMNVRYTLEAGHRDMRCDVFCSSPLHGGTERGLEGLCTGVQTIPAKGGKDTITIILPNGVLLGSWGTDWPVNDSAKYAKETVGLGVFIPKEYAGELVHDKQNNLCLLKQKSEARSQKSEISGQKSDKPYTAHFYLTCCGATKENHPVATNAEEWYAYLRHWAAKLK